MKSHRSGGSLKESEQYHRKEQRRHDYRAKDVVQGKDGREDNYSSFLRVEYWRFAPVFAFLESGALSFIRGRIFLIID